MADGLNVGAPGIVGDGVTDNRVALQAALTAVQGGDQIQLPCGTYKITGSITATIAPGKNITFIGAGQECTILYFSGSGGLVFVKGSNNSSVNIGSFTNATDTTGAQSAIQLINPNVESNPALDAPSFITNVNIRSIDMYRGNKWSDYWQYGIVQNNWSNVNILFSSFTGNKNLQGVGVRFVGKSASNNAVVSNVYGCFLPIYNMGMSMTNTRRE